MSDTESPLVSLPHRETIITDVLVHQELARRQIWSKCGERTASFESGPMLWGTKYTQTEDDHWLYKGTPAVAPFPAKEYLLVAMRYMLMCETLFIPKSREMMTSWLACLYISWMCQFLPHIFWILQTEKEDKVVQLINYCRILYNRQPEWMRQRHVLEVSNSVELKFSNGSHIMGVPAGENQVRLFHSYGYLQDESAFLPEAEQSFNAVRPVVKQIIAISSDEVSWFHTCCKR